MTRAPLLALAAALALVAAAPVSAEETPFEATTLRLSAEGESHAAPDLAVITLGVETEAATAAEALRRNSAQMAATLAVLKAQGVAGKDIQTSGLSLNAQYSFQDNVRRFTGYQASNAVTVTVRELARLGAAVDAVVAAGANQVNGVSFGLSDPQKAEDEARRAAVKALAVKAALYAEAAGYRVSRLVSLSDAAAPARPMMMMAAAPRMKTATPVEPGELDVTATLSAVYELKK